MGKTWGVIGGFLLGFFVMILASIIMWIATVSMLFSSTESMTDKMPGGGKMPSGGTVSLLAFGYLAGWIASVYFGYGFSYDTGFADCKKDS
jgi:hypothetical protein